MEPEYADDDEKGEKGENGVGKTFLASALADGKKEEYNRKRTIKLKENPFE